MTFPGLENLANCPKLVCRISVMLVGNSSWLEKSNNCKQTNFELEEKKKNRKRNTCKWKCCAILKQIRFVRDKNESSDINSSLLGSDLFDACNEHALHAFFSSVECFIPQIEDLACTIECVHVTVCSNLREQAFVQWCRLFTDSSCPFLMSYGIPKGQAYVIVSSYVVA